MWQSVAPAAVECHDDGRNPGIHALYNDPKAFCASKVGLWIAGPSRVGKTWLAYRCLRTFARTGKSIKVLKAAELNGMTETAESLRELKSVGTLLVDDFDKTLFNERNTQLLFAIIDATFICCSGVRLPSTAATAGSLEPRQCVAIAPKMGPSSFTVSRPSLRCISLARSSFATSSFFVTRSQIMF